MGRRNSREVWADTAEEGMIAEPQDLEYGGSEWSEQLRSAVREAIAAAVIEHQRKGESRVLRGRCGLLMCDDARRP
jgi:hypothetical protein